LLLELIATVYDLSILVVESILALQLAVEVFIHLFDLDLLLLDILLYLSLTLPERKDFATYL
jgi:hypothetical protein